MSSSTGESEDGEGEPFNKSKRGAQRRAEKQFRKQEREAYVRAYTNGRGEPT